uniref:Piwi domain-containing protein n=1 Tax=Panagrolaimus sp. PS1159 TaxID=55785 RepID=A0AC35GWK0_9BILA
MSSSPNAEEGSGSPLLSDNENGRAAVAGALSSSSDIAPTSNGNGHGCPRSGMDSPTNVFRIEQQNKLLLKLMNIEPGQDHSEIYCFTLCEKLCYAPGAHVTLIVSSLLHNLRFKQIDSIARAHEQNIPPGTVIDTTVVHAKFVEFYLNSHIAIQETAKTPLPAPIYRLTKLSPVVRFTKKTTESYNVC